MIAGQKFRRAGPYRTATADGELSGLAANQRHDQGPRALRRCGDGIALQQRSPEQESRSHSLTCARPAAFAPPPSTNASPK
jgi:hypothetical protein